VRSSSKTSWTPDRRGKNTQLPLPDLLRRPFIVGWQDEDVNDAERRSQDPTFRLIGSEKI